MRKKFLFPASIVCGLALIGVAVTQYPGGSQQDAASKGFSLQHNYLCNLFDTTAMNGSDNPGRYFAMAGMFVLCCSMALFFYRFSKKQVSPSLKKLIAFSGIASMFFACFIMTPLHNIMTTLSGTLVMLAMFAILVSLYRAQYYLLLWLGVFCILVLYFTNYVYYSGQFIEVLPVLQKTSFSLMVIWFLLLEYFVVDRV